MGTSTRSNGLTNKQIRVSTKLLIDVPLLIATAMLLIAGLLMLYSASWNYALQIDRAATYIVVKQLIWILLGVFIAFLLTQFDYHILSYSSKLLLVVTLGLLAFVLTRNAIFGYTRNLIGNSAQPSEMAKIVLVIFLADWLSKRQGNLSTLRFGTLPAMIIIAGFAGLIFLQPDFSASLTITVLGVVMFIIAGGRIKHFVIPGFLAVLASFFGYALFPKVSLRLNDYISGFMNPAEASYHLQRSYEAILRGGVFGVGIGKGVTKLTGLPVAWTDSIFSVILEEVGLLGGCFFIGLYLVILWRGIVIAWNAPDAFGKLLAAGVTTWIVMEATINIAVLVNLLPFAGNALPFVSSGGSSMLFSMIGIGILLSVSRYSASESIRKGRSEPDAFINMRGGDWGWRLSSLGRRSRNRR